MLGYSRHKTDSTSTPSVRISPRVEELEDRAVPALIANGDFYNVALGRVLTVNAANGVLSNDYSDLPANAGKQQVANLIQGPTYTTTPQPLPANSLQLNEDGSFRFIAPDTVPLGANTVTFTYQAQNTAGEISATTTVTITLYQQNMKMLAVGAQAGGGPHVRVYQDGTGVVRFNFFPYEQTFTGGVRVAVGDVNNDGYDDIATIPASGGSARVRVFDGKDGAPLVDQIVFDPNFRGGGYVAIGDWNGDGVKDVIVGAGEGGGPRVQAFTLKGAPIGTMTLLNDFFAYDPSMTTGVRVAAGSTLGNGRAQIITAPGVGGGPQVNVYDIQQLLTSVNNTAKPILTFFAADSNNRDGVNIAAGDLSGTGKYDIIAGSGSGSGIVRAFDGRTGGLLREFGVPNDEVPAGSGVPSGPTTFNLQTPQSGTLLAPTVRPTSLVTANIGTLSGLQSGVRGGVTVTATDWNGDGIDDIVTGNGLGNVPRVRVFNTLDQTEFTDFLAFSANFLGGVSVGGS